MIAFLRTLVSLESRINIEFKNIEGTVAVNQSRASVLGAGSLPFKSQHQLQILKPISIGMIFY